MNRGTLSILWLALACLLPGCGTLPRHGLDPQHAREIEASRVCREWKPSREVQQKILALDPEQVTDADIRGVLSNAPAPRIINIHGGVSWVIARMVSFSEFLIGMGYPGQSLTNPGDGTYSFSCYESSAKIAGVIAWYYEREGLRPMVVGHSQGGIQAVKVLDKLAGVSATRLHVWNPLTWEKEEACEITDPLTHQRRPVVGLQLSFASSVGAGGLTRILPNQWDMCFKLRQIPNSVEEFTGFCKTKDLFGGDYLGYGSANEFEPTDKAVVRNVWLPSSYRHGHIPDTKHLLQSRQMIDWINNYQPSLDPVDPAELETKFEGDHRHILWAAEVWHSIKKHWVIELQRLIRAREGKA
jgi:hypothetical protein